MVWRGKEVVKEGRERVRHVTTFPTYVPPLLFQDSPGSASDTSLKLFPGSARKHGRLLASPPMCVPEVQEKTHVKR